MENSLKYYYEQGLSGEVICKKTGKVFADYTNVSGALIRHIQKEYGIEIPSKYERSKYLTKTGKYWHEDYFDFKLVENKPTRKCQYCDWTTIDVENKTGCFEQHLKQEHNISLEGHLELYPDDIIYHKNFQKKINLDNDHIKCEVCGEKLEKLTLTHLKTHNLTYKEYKLKYPGAKIINDRLSKLSSNLLTTKNQKKEFKKTFVSKAENEIYDYLSSNGIKLEKTCRNLISGELDLVDHNKKIAIEYDGIYFHSEKFKDKNYHLDKTIKCNEKGYRLIHIFEDEWIENKDLVLSKLSHIFGLNKNEKIYARNCIIKPISSKEKNQFLDKNHIQGKDKSKIYYGAFYNNKLVAVMCFSKTTLSKKETENDWELTRFATDINYNIIGIGSKMIAHFIKNNDVKNIISFADRRWVDINNNIYEKLGFVKVSISSPDYYYVGTKGLHKNMRIHKTNLRKEKIKKMFKIDITGKTELELATELGYVRTYNCGLIKYKYEKN